VVVDHCSVKMESGVLGKSLGSETSQIDKPVESNSSSITAAKTDSAAAMMMMMKTSDGSATTAASTADDLAQVPSYRRKYEIKSETRTSRLRPDKDCNLWS